jgi:hypothetical protein
MQPVEVWGVQIATNIDKSLSTAVIQFQISNTLTEPQSVGVVLDTTILMHGERQIYIYKQADGSGFRAVAGLSHFQVFCQNYPMVTDVDAYWFGQSAALENSLYSQVTDSVFEGEDGAMALSWRDRIIPARTRVVLSVLMTWGEGADRPEVDLDVSTPLPTANDTISWTETVSVGGAITVPAGTSTENTVIYLVVDGEVVAEVPVDSSGKFTIEFTPSALRLAGGLHEFRVFAIDASGSIAPIAAFTTVIVAPTERQSQTAMASQTPTASPTASASWGDIVDLPWYPDDVAAAADEGITSLTVAKIVVGAGLPIGVLLIAGFAYLIHRYRAAMRAEIMQRLRADSQTDASQTGIGI